ncbi:MAG: Serine/threonine-protein kinase PknD [bacterium]|nr:Serine/threonine-protein kinase PknD [bacterium]
MTTILCIENELNWLSDKLVNHLRTVAEAPDLSGTKYRLLEKFSAGGMGTIYLAEDMQLQRRVALKVLHTPAGTGELTARMWREARVIAKLEHPGIVPVHDVGELPDGRVFYVMKFVQGQRLDQYSDAESELPNRLRIFQKICEAVAFAHTKGVLHRDLKPENIMVGAFGEVLVMDWGLAKIVGEGGEQKAGSREQRAAGKARDSANGKVADSAAHETLHGTVIGTPAYMAPEQKRGAINQIDQRTDVYALGAILSFLLIRPNETELAQKKSARAATNSNASPASLNSKIPKALAAICTKAMAEEKTQRYASALELAHDIERFLNGLAVSSYKENVFEQAWRWLKQYRFIVLLVLIYLLVRILLILLLRP